MKRIVKFLLGVIIIFLIFINKNVSANTPSSVYVKLTPSATEVMPGEDVYINFSIHNTDSIPASEQGISVLMLYLYYDSSKFEIEYSNEAAGQRAISDKAITLSPTWDWAIRWPNEVMSKYEIANPDYITIQVLYNHLSRDYITDGDMFTFKFTALESASGTGDFHLVSDDVYNIVITEPSRINIPVDNSQSLAQVKITGEPENEYTINFDSNGGTAVAPITAVYGDPISAPDAPIKTGYEFLGWYDSNDALYTFTTMPNHNVELIAKWKPIEYLIKYDANGGVGSIASQSATYDTKLTLNTNTFTRPGYTFKGWSTSPSGSVEYIDGEEVENLMTNPGELTLYAVWEKIAYNLFINSPYVIVKRGSETLTNGSKVYIDDVLSITYDRFGYSGAKIYVNSDLLLSNNYTVEAGDVQVTISDEELINYNITYHLDGGTNSPLNPTTYTVNSSPITLQEPTKNGYRFVGWYTLNVGGTKVEFINPANATDVTLYARWQEELTIKLDPNGGLINESSDIYEFTIFHNENFGSNLLTPTRVGYTFVGWYTELTGGTRITPNSKATASVTLYARWQVKYTTITFVSNGGTSVPNITDSYGKLIDEPTIPTRIGYTFVGWFIDNNTFNTKQEFPLSMPEDDLVLYAKWEINSYTITFDSNGGSIVSSITENFGTNITKPTDPTKSGYVFAGWYTDNFTFANEFSFTTMPAENVVLYAKWLRVYEIIFDSQGGSHHDAIEVIENTKVGTLPTPTKTGYNFLGWYTEINGGGVKVDANTNYRFSSDITLYAHYEAIKYTISFNTNGGSSISSITGNYNDPIIWPTNPTKIGYRFIGWYKDNNTFNIPYTAPTNMPAENITLYAKWEIRNDIRITFVTNGGSEIAPLEDLTYGTSLTLPNTTRSGYKFAGWYLDPSLTLTFTSSTVPAEDVVLYAKWLKEYQITFVSNSEDNISPIIRYENETFGSLPTPSKLGHSFQGWYTTPDFASGTKVESNTVVTDSVTLYAKFVEEIFEIRFHSNGGSEITPNPQAYTYGAVITEPAIPTKAGYIFAGWYSDTGLTTQFIFNTMPAHDVDLYAKWVEEDLIEYTIYLNNYDNQGGVLTITRYGTSTYSFPVEDVKGYSLIGWYRDSSFDESSLVKSDDIVGGVETEIHLYAKWKIKLITLTLMVDGVVYHTIIDNYNVDIFEPTSPTKVGHTFIGWFKSSDGGNTLTEEFVFDKMPSSDLVIYAKFDENLYTVTFDSNGGNLIAPLTRSYLSNLVLPTPVRDGYKFLGWYDENDNLVSSPYIVVEDISLTAKWEILGYDDTTIDIINVLDMNDALIKSVVSVGKKITIYVPYEYENIKLDIKPLYDITTVTYISNHTLISGNEVVVDVEVVALSGRVDSYEVTIIRDTNPILSDISLNNGLSINFDGSLSYNLNAPINLTNVDINVETVHEKNKITINGQTVSLTGMIAGRNIGLNAAGSNTIIKVVVTSLSDEESTEYQITIYRSNQSNDAGINLLSVFGNNSYANELKQVGTDILGFNKDVLDYYINVEYRDTSLIVNPTYASGASGIITGNNNLQVGSNVVTINVTAGDGITKKTYTIEVIREAPSSEALLDEVRIKNLDTNKIEYQEVVTIGKINIINVPYEYQRINLIPVKSTKSANATVVDLGNIDLVEGINDFVITITAEDGITTNDYQIRIIRAYGNTDNTLRYLSIGGLTLTPNLDLDNIFTYSLTDKLAYSTYNLLVEAEKNSPEYGYITIKYDSTSPVETNSLYIYPVVGTSTIQIVVHPQKGETKTYTITIEKENISGVYELSSLIIKDYSDFVLPLNPNFNMQVLNYDLGSIAYTYDKLKIIASPVIGSEIQSVKVNGNGSALINNEYIANLAVGINEIIITVASSLNPSLTKSYTVLVNREAGEDINTATITASEGYLEKTGNTYNLTLPKSSTGFILNVYPDSNKSKVIIDGMEATSRYIDFTGKTTAIYQIEVVSEMGNSNIYTLEVNRSILSDNPDLKHLTIKTNKSNQEFSFDSFPISFTVPYIDDMISFNPSFIDIGATLSAYSAPLAVGLNQIVLTATAEDGITKKNYLINITRESPSDIALLENIIIRDLIFDKQYGLNEIFSYSNFIYSSNVDFSTSEVKIIPITYTGYGITYEVRRESGVVIGEVASLSQGENKFVIEVFSEQNTSNIYHLTITRELGDSNTGLEYLELSDQDLDYQEDKLVYPDLGFYEYSYDVNYVYLNAKTLSSTSKITLQIDSSIYNFGTEINYRIDLKTGITVVRVIVTAESGQEVSYRINLRKAASTSEIDIFDLIVSGLDNNDNEVEDFDLYDSLGNLISFDLNNSVYYVNIPYSYKKVKINPQVVNSNYTPTDLIFDVIPGEVVRVDIKVESLDGLNYNIYSVFIYGEIGDDNTKLDFLEVLDGNNNNYLVDFNPDKYVYDIIIPKSLDKLSFFADPESSKSTIIIGDKTKKPYPATEVDVSEDVDIYVWVEAENGDSKPYVVRVRKSQKSDNAYLESITITDNHGNDITTDLIPKFDPTKLVYQIVVEYNVSEINISGVGMEGAKIISSTRLADLEVLPETNILEIETEASDGSRLTYTFIVFRLLPMQDSSLAKIELGEDLIDVEDNVYEYDKTFSYSTENVKLNLTPNSRIDKILVNGIPYEMNMELELELGLNKVEIEVIAEDGITSSIYTLNILRDIPSKKAYIEDLDVVNADNAKFMEKLLDGNYLETSFNPFTFIQYIFVESYQDSIALKPTISENSRLKDYEEPVIEASLDIGYNIVPITVVAEDGETENTYFFVIKRKGYSNNTKIKEINVNNGLELNKLSNNLFRVKGRYNTKELDLEIVLEDENAVYEVIGNENIKGNDVVTILVTAEDGQTVSTYYITIEKDFSMLYLIINTIIFAIIIPTIGTIVTNVLEKRRYILM